jgi:hypothetical protein
MNNVEDSESNIDTANLEKNADEAVCYVGICPEHSWSSMHRDNYSDAAADLEGHIGLFPDESHSGSRVGNC